MLRGRKEKWQGMELVILEQMVLANHLLRKIDRSIDFSFIGKLCAPPCTAKMWADRPWSRKLCSACCLWAICTESAWKDGWRKKPTTTLPKMVLRTGAYGKSAGCDDHQRKPHPSVP